MLHFSSLEHYHSKSSLLTGLVSAKAVVLHNLDTCILLALKKKYLIIDNGLNDFSFEVATRGEDEDVVDEVWNSASLGVIR